jgi:hypothetical protein
MNGVRVFKRYYTTKPIIWSLIHLGFGASLVLGAWYLDFVNWNLVFLFPSVGRLEALPYSSDTR